MQPVYEVTSSSDRHHSALLPVATKTRNNHSFVIKGGIDCFKPSTKLKPQEIVRNPVPTQKPGWKVSSAHVIQHVSYTSSPRTHPLLILTKLFHLNHFFHVYHKLVPKGEHNALLQFLGCYICRDLSCSFIPQSQQVVQWVKQNHKFILWGISNDTNLQKRSYRDRPQHFQ